MLRLLVDDRCFLHVSKRLLSLYIFNVLNGFIQGPLSDHVPEVAIVLTLPVKGTRHISLFDVSIILSFVN